MQPSNIPGLASEPKQTAGAEIVREFSVYKHKTKRIRGKPLQLICGKLIDTKTGKEVKNYERIYEAAEQGLSFLQSVQKEQIRTAAAAQGTEIVL